MTCSPHASWILGETHPHHVPALRRLPSEHLPQHTPLRTVHSSAIGYYISHFCFTVLYHDILLFADVCSIFAVHALSCIHMLLLCCSAEISAAEISANLKRISLIMCEILQQSAAQRKANSEVRVIYSSSLFGIELTRQETFNEDCLSRLQVTLNSSSFVLVRGKASRFKGSNTSRHLQHTTGAKW